MIERVVVGIDGSANAGVALDWAIGLAGALGAEVVAVHAVGLRESERHDPADARRLRERFEHEWCARLDASGPAGTRVTHRKLLVDGDPVSVLLRTVEDLDADLVVVGSRGVGDRAELLLGSTSSQVTQHSPVPVVVIPPHT